MDIKINQTLGGGDFDYNGADLTMIEGLENQVYLAYFGGNPGFTTPFERTANEQAFDWWGNAFLEQGQQFNSYTENALSTNALSSSGRSEIEKAAKKDLNYMSDFAETNVSVTIDSEKRVSIIANLKEPTKIENREYRFIWDSTKEELDGNNPDT